MIIRITTTAIEKMKKALGWMRRRRFFFFFLRGPPEEPPEEPEGWGSRSPLGGVWRGCAGRWGLAWLARLASWMKGGG